MLVAVGMFALLMTMIVSALLTMIHVNRQGNALSITTSNLNFALESMTRYIRIGDEYDCPGADSPDCPDLGSNEFTFRSSLDLDGNTNSSDEDIVTYRFANGAIERDVDGTGFISMTGDDLVIDETVSKFYVRGARSLGTGDEYQPRVVVVLKATADVVGRIAEFNLQTTAVQRVPDH
jgi:hypothetical protein